MLDLSVSENTDNHESQYMKENVRNPFASEIILKRISILNKNI